MNITFPLITKEMQESAKIEMAASLWPTTLCLKCGFENYGFRLGCQCGGKIDWIFKTQDGRYLKPGIDVCLLQGSVKE